MGRSHSNDLRERVAAAILSGRTCREVATQFSVSAASAARWSQRLRQTGSAAAKPQGRQRRSLLPHLDWIRARLKAQPNLSMRALTLELGKRGIVTSEASVWRIVHRDRPSPGKHGHPVKWRHSRLGGQTPVIEAISSELGRERLVNPCAMIDSTITRAPQHGAGAPKKRGKIKPSDDLATD